MAVSRKPLKSLLVLHVQKAFFGLVWYAFIPLLFWVPPALILFCCHKPENNKVIWIKKLDKKADTRTYFICPVVDSSQRSEGKHRLQIVPLCGLSTDEDLNVLTSLPCKWHAEMWALFPVNANFFIDSLYKTK